MQLSEILARPGCKELIDINVLEFLRCHGVNKKIFLDAIHRKIGHGPNNNDIFGLFMEFHSLPVDDPWSCAFYSKNREKEITEKISHYFSNLDSLVDCAIPEMILGDPGRKILPVGEIDSFRKGYENFHIARLLAQMSKSADFTEIVDVGSGRGLLGDTLMHLRPFLHSIGVDRKVPRCIDSCCGHLTSFLNYSNVHCASTKSHLSPRFIHMHLPCANFESLLSKPYRFSVGLHCCGNLALDHLLVAGNFNTVGALSIGCCYHMLSPERIGTTSVVHSFMRSTLRSKNALHLANLRHDTPSGTLAEDIYRKRFYRYAVEILSSHYDDWRQRLTVRLRSRKAAKVKGNSFVEYVQQWLQCGNENSHQLSKSFYQLSECEIMFLQNFFASPETKELLFTASRLRAFQSRLFGRPLETLIHLDRALLMHEKFGEKYDIVVRRIFPASISSRNVGILLQKKKSLSVKQLLC